MIIGITGGTGGGKTTALNVLRELGAVIIDCDAVYHELLRSSVPMNDELRGEFPTAYVDGALDRKKLGSIVFSQAERLEILNHIIYKYVIRRVDELTKGLPLCAIDAINLIDSGLYRRCDALVAVTAPRELRINRIMARDGVSREYAEMRINAQRDDEYYTSHCGHTLVNDCDEAIFRQRCMALFTEITGGQSMSDMKERLFYSRKNGWDIISDGEKKAVNDFCESYKSFLNTAKTERLAVKESIRLLEAAGYVPYQRGMELKAGTKIYKSNRGKSLLIAIIGTAPLSEGINVAAAHIDSPRLDLKQIPVYEDNELVYFRTHYYGGIKKYQWVTIPLELHGVVSLMDGTDITVSIGQDPADPVLMITDLLPHLAKDQMTKTAAEVVAGEQLNIIVGSIPDGEEKDGDRVKLAVLKILNEKYGITEEDFLSAELEVVPSIPVRDAGLDSSMIAGYGQDDRVCAYAELKAIIDCDAPEKTAVCILADKEEIGSEGVSGMQSEAFECFIADLCDSQGVNIRHCFENSFCISADVTVGFDPLYAEVSEKTNAAKLNYGVGILKYTGHRGKAQSNDASAEVVGKVRRWFRDNGVVWQMSELGKVDQGGGGTVAKYMAKRNIDTIDAGVPVLSMHSPYELTAKFDCYMTYKAVKSMYDSKK